MAGAFWKGMMWGGVVSVVGAATVSLMSEPPANTPGRSDTPIYSEVEPPLTERDPEAMGDPMVALEGADVTDPLAPVADETAEAPDGTDTAMSPDDASEPEMDMPTGEDTAPQITLNTPEQPGSDAQTAGDQVTLPTITETDAVPMSPVQPIDMGPEDTPDPAQPTAPMPELPEVDMAEIGLDEDSVLDPDPVTPEQDPEVGIVAAPVVSDIAPELPPVEPERVETSPSIPPVTIQEPEGNIIDARREAEKAAAEADSSINPDDNILPLSVYAAPFSNPDDKPLLSIVMLDNPTGGLGPVVLQDFPYPLTIAIDALAPDALGRMNAYRKAGFEVLATAKLPEGATPADAEIALDAIFDAVPEAIGLMEYDDGSIQQSRDLSDQISAALGDGGYGLLLQTKGLNTAQKSAVKAGVPAVSIFRDLDGKGQNADVIRRFLDNAAFKTRQGDEGVVVLTRLRPESLSALLIWALQDRANQVALAPVSAVLKQSVSQ